MASNTPSTLSPAQLRALFDILNHNETYREAESFKRSYAIREYGYPFAADISTQRKSPPDYHPESKSPLFQLFLTKCVLTVPGMTELPPDFWPLNFQGIMTKLADANLSESYDKGTLGTRKTLATGASVIHEALTRGLLEGVDTDDKRIDLKKAKYDTTQAPELDRAWNECVHELIHGNLADELFDAFISTPDFEAHSPAVKVATDYAILNVASLLHHIFVLSPEGQYLLKLIENVYKLIPFSMVRQTLRIGNAATMINGMMRIFLAKMSVGAMTNWMGLTNGAEDGMNLLQRIISMVLSWDATEFRKQASQIENSKDRPTKEQFAALRDYVEMPSEAKDAMREISMKQEKSIVVVAFETLNPDLMASLSESQHTQCLEWLSATLSAQDRDAIANVLCRSNPDYVTSVVRALVSTYEPFIRNIHESMDLREHITAVEVFVADFIESSKPKKVKSGWKFKSNKTKTEDIRPPSVEDYVALIRRNKHMIFNYLHQFAKNCTDLREQFRGWVNLGIKEFSRRHESNQPSEQDSASGLSDKLQLMFAQLPRNSQSEVLKKLDVHASYLSKLDNISELRMQRVMDQLAKQDAEGENTPASKSGNSSTKSSRSPSPRSSTSGPNMSGPGVYLMRWDALLDETLVTPATPSGRVRTGKDIKGRKAWGKTISESVKGGWDAGAIAREEDAAVPDAPNVDIVMETLGDQFKDLVNEKIGDVVPALSEKVDYLMRGEELASGVQGMVLAG